MDRVKQTVALFAGEHINAGLYYENEDPDFVDLVPTSAITGEGIPDLLARLVDIAQRNLNDRILWKPEL
jgi:translation initiation factor 5B